MLYLLCYEFSFSLMTHHFFFFFYSFTFFLFLFFLLFSHFTGDWLRAQEAVEDALSLLQQERWVRWSLIRGDDRIWWQDMILYDMIWYDMICHNMMSCNRRWCVMRRDEKKKNEEKTFFFWIESNDVLYGNQQISIKKLDIKNINHFQSEKNCDKHFFSRFCFVESI